MKIRTVEISVGLFFLIGVLSVMVLYFKISGMSLSADDDVYELYAEFDNVGSLSDRSKVSLAGVLVGRVVDIELDRETYMAKVTMEINRKIDNIPIDSTAAIETEGLLGEKYIGISIGGSTEWLKSGDWFDDTQSAIVLEELIGKFILD